MKTKLQAEAYARYKLIRDAVAQKGPIAPELVNACRTQSSLATFESADLGVSRLSLNSLKAAAELVVEDGGWAHLDLLRRQIKGARSSSQPSKKKRVSQSRRETNDLDTADRGRLLIGRAYLDLLSLIRSVSARDDELASKLRRHMDMWRDQLSLPLTRHS